jgi:hypothetical protein
MPKGELLMNSMFKKITLPLNMQRFVEVEPNPNPTPTPAPTPNPTPAPAPQGTVFSEEYVKSLRGEAANHRTEKQKFQAHIRTIMGLGADVEINDTMVSNFIKDQGKAQAEALKTANARLLSAEIKSLQGYDAKLVDRLLDKSKITIGDDGTVTGLTEAVAALEAEFPAIKIGTGSGTGGANPAGGGGTGLTEIQQLEEDYAKATTTAMRIAIKNKIFALQSKQ